MTSSTRMPRSHSSAEATCPYLGLVPFDESDVPYFFGRDRDTEIIVANLTAARLTLLYAASGVGKSSVLRAGVVPRLRKRGEDDHHEELGIARSAVAYVREWSSAPLEAAAVEIRRALDGADPPPTGAPAPSFGLNWLRSAMQGAGVGTLYLIFDQLEEYLFHHPAGTRSDELTSALSEVLAAHDLDVHVLLSVREDALAQLDRFKGRVPRLFGNYLRLAHLTRAAAHTAITGPIEVYNQRVGAGQAFTVEPALVEELLDQVRTGKVKVGDEGSASDAGAATESGDIETPYLQLVLTRLWEQERRAGSRTLRLRTLEELGGAQTIVKSHLDNKMAKLDAGEVELAATLLQHLVVSPGSKAALTAEYLADVSGLPVERVRASLEMLAEWDWRILRAVPPAAGSGPSRYEVFHDVMGSAVLDWRRRYTAERRQELATRQLKAEREEAEAAAREARRRLRSTLLCVAVGVLLLVTAGLVVVTYQSTQGSQQRQLLGDAADALEQNPELSLRKALEAYRIGDSPSSRSAVLRAASIPRAQTIAGPGDQTHDMIVAGIDVTSDGVHVVAFDGGGRILVHHADGAPAAEVRVPDLDGQVTDVAVAPDASRIAVATDRGELTVVDAATGTRQRDLVTDWTTRADVSWLGQATAGLLLVSSANTATTYDATSGAVTARFPSVLWAAALDEQRVATSSSDDGRVRVWGARSGQLLAQSEPLPAEPTFLEPYEESVVGLALDPGGSGSGEIVVWDWQTSTEPLRHPFRYSNDVADMTVDEVTDSVRITSDKEVLTFSLRDGAALGVVPQQPTPVVDTETDADGWWVATAGSDGRVLVWCAPASPRPAQPTYELLGNGSAIEEIEFLTGNSLTLMARSTDGRLWQWDLPRTPRLTEHEDWVPDIDLSRDGRWLATAGTDGYGLIVGTADVTRSVARLGLGREPLTTVRIAPSDPHRVFTLERFADRPVMWLWNENEAPKAVDTLERIKAFQRLVSLAVSPDGGTVAAGDDEGNVHIWDTQTGRLLRDRELPGNGYPASAVAFDPSGRQLARTTREGIGSTDMITRTERVLPHPNATHVDFDASGTQLVSVADGGTVRVWSSDGTRTQELVAHGSRLARASFSPDGALVAAGSADGLVEVWDVRSGTTLALTRQHGDSVNDVLFAGQQLLTASDDTTVTASSCESCADPEKAIDAAEDWLTTQ